MIVDWLKWSEREVEMNWIGMKTYNQLFRNMNEMNNFIQWRKQANKSIQLHFTSLKQKENNFLFLFMKFNESVDLLMEWK